jgi:hypothetical protein
MCDATRTLRKALPRGTCYYKFAIDVIALVRQHIELRPEWRTYAPRQTTQKNMPQRLHGCVKKDNFSSTHTPTVRTNGTVTVI